jgi:hypothetical protein
MSAASLDSDWSAEHRALSLSLFLPGDRLNGPRGSLDPPTWGRIAAFFRMREKKERERKKKEEERGQRALLVAWGNMERGRRGNG